MYCVLHRYMYVSIYIYIYTYIYMCVCVSINGGTPKWLVYTGKSHSNWWFRGAPISALAWHSIITYVHTIIRSSSEAFRYGSEALQVAAVAEVLCCQRPFAVNGCRSSGGSFWSHGKSQATIPKVSFLGGQNWENREQWWKLGKHGGKWRKIWEKIGETLEKWRNIGGNN